MPGALLAARPLAEVVEVPVWLVLSLSGTDAPGAPAFQQAISALHRCAFTLTFPRKKAKAPLCDSLSGSSREAAALGKALAETLIGRGADAILRESALGS